MAAQFRCVDAAVIRVAVLSGSLELPPWPDLTGDTPEHMREWRIWLARVWQQEALVEAIEVASPLLARRVEDVERHAHHGTKKPPWWNTPASLIR